ncbi:MULTISPECIES: ubiquinol-cytochrome c reductase iron-sulfur subunit [unclassified Nocardioides]|uniref:cytochrome bc1 complex Rieske iron-sulfur subunit n=1 Tax=unclassified Nocardioides TaxID=2615069 RepID=UPI0006F69C2C|nr:MULTISPECIES: Rieske 2Fe-2S domain-containing protein [unclassified Nocardioides]KQY63910.1 ubiquinol-cytochrome C reductase [Nocardioides sp. Root140]KQZ69828.1 ubiquinol-cytochrome C reductase [Nocardioides sp. Root151]KRF15924.1 ubiquinol-cytochrome C reductase [Nocardioides sp. Soil796]
MSDHHDTESNHLPASVEEPIANPGLPAHKPRPTDVDVKAERRAERQVAAFFVLSMICAVLFCVAYFTLDIKDETDTFIGLGASNVALGATLGLALMFIGIGVIHWARKLMGDVEIFEMRHPAASSPEDREETLAQLSAGLEESGIARRPLIRNTMLGAMGMLGLPLIVGLRDLGTLPGKKLESTVWAKGTRIVRDVTGTPVKPSQLEVGDLMNAQPEGLVTLHHEEDVAEGEARGVEYLEGVDLQVAKSKAAVILLRMEPKDLTFSERSPQNWQVDGIVAYSKICTHVGCPISLNEQQSHHLLCPCHQSTFDLADGGRVVFGPAARPLPQLPLRVENGYLVAQSDFREPVGPSYWERDSK